MEVSDWCKLDEQNNGLRCQQEINQEKMRKINRENMENLMSNNEIKAQKSFEVRIEYSEFIYLS